VTPIKKIQRTPSKIACASIVQSVWLPAIASTTVINAKVIIRSVPLSSQCLRRRRRVNHTRRQNHNEENCNIPKDSFLPTSLILVFGLTGMTFGNIPLAVVVLSGTTSLESRNGSPVSNFHFL
jgi:hypothetical protein